MDSIKRLSLLLGYYQCMYNTKHLQWNLLMMCNDDFTKPKYTPVRPHGLVLSVIYDFKHHLPSFHII